MYADGMDSVLKWRIWRKGLEIATQCVYRMAKLPHSSL